MWNSYEPGKSETKTTSVSLLELYTFCWISSRRRLQSDNSLRSGISHDTFENALHSADTRSTLGSNILERPGNKEFGGWFTNNLKDFRKFILRFLPTWLSGQDVGLWLANFPWFMPDLWLTCDDVTTSLVKFPLWVDQPGQLSLPSIWGR